MSQSAPHPHDISNLIEPALIEIVHAVSDRPGQGMEEYQAKADATWALLESFQPRDVIDLLLSGQLVAFNAVFADATNGLLRGMDDTLKKQTLSSLVSMGRVTQGHVDRLAKRGNQPYQTAIATPEPAAQPKPVAAAPAAGQPSPIAAGPPVVPPAAPPSVAAAPVAAAPVAGLAPVAAPEASPHPAPTPAVRTAEPTPRSAVAETSWLDEPYQEYVIETPGLLAAMEATARTAAVLTLMEAVQRSDGTDTPSAEADSRSEVEGAS